MKRTLTYTKKSNFCCYHELDWENSLLNSIGLGPFTGHNKAPVKAYLEPKVTSTMKINNGLV